MTTDPDPSGRPLLRPLLPRPRPGQPAPHQLPDPDCSFLPRVIVACDACRALKVKCDARRPSCSKCERRNRPCVYETAAPAERRYDALKRKYGDVESQRDAYKNLFAALATRSEAEAADIFRRVRRGADVGAILRQVEDGDLLLQLHLAPEARMQYTFPYLKQLPTLLLRNNPYVESLIYRSVSLTLTEPEAKAAATPNLPSCQADELANNPYLIPYHAAEVVDPRFGFVKAAPWTAIVDDDRLFVTLLKAYFQFTHPYWSLFHKDCFLDDLVSNRSEFCSPLLVNAVLASACHGATGIANRADFWDPRSLECRLLDECRRLFELELGAPKLSTVQAAAVLSLANDANGCDEVGNMYLEQAVKGAAALDLFSAPDSALSKRAVVSHAFTAWGLFSMQAVHRFHVFRPPLIELPPQIPLPGPGGDESMCGEVWLRYPGGQLLYPLDFGVSFKAACKFRTILNDIGSYFFGTNAAQLDEISLQQAMLFHSRMLQWYEELPPQLSAAKIKYPHQLKLHMHYYSVLILLFQAVVAKLSSTATRANVPKELDPHHILADAKNRMELLLRLYFLRHGFESFDIFMVHLLSYIGFLHLKELHVFTTSSDSSTVKSIPEDVVQARTSMVVLAAKGLHDQGANCYLGEVVFGMLKDKMGPEIFRMVHGLLRTDGRAEDSEARKALIAVHLRSAWPVGVIAIDEDFERLRLSSHFSSSETSIVTGRGADAEDETGMDPST